jgi:hypothetical protein
MLPGTAKEAPVRISLCLLRGGVVVGTDTYEILTATKTETGITFQLAQGSLTLEGQITKDLDECAQAINQGYYLTTSIDLPHEPSQNL